MQWRRLSEIFSNSIFFIKILYSIVVEPQGLTATSEAFFRLYPVCPLYEPTLLTLSGLERSAARDVRGFPARPVTRGADQAAMKAASCAKGSSCAGDKLERTTEGGGHGRAGASDNPVFGTEHATVVTPWFGGATVGHGGVRKTSYRMTPARPCPLPVASERRARQLSIDSS